ncbi:S26 family signal peptidase [Amycolatopsis magusensis]|uniref:S26 family signal peptidase n=1 Tax=Amycolatopsis magusensis TaxID=882444 RepID=UPI0024A83A02|nr:S26 family signal peptidase [Amycolatopsis magusensis]MDI5976180.1 S26 family signal peptidase [Amycolatopsis magusensis]
MRTGRVAAALVVSALAGFGVRALARQWVSVTVRGPSMEPAYRHGDRLLARRRPGTLRAGDVVVFEGPVRDGGWELPVAQAGDTARGWLVKRVVAVGGDPVPTHFAGAAPAGEVVPPGQVFVLGDNREVSVDSRRIGCVPVERVLGRAVHIGRRSTKAVASG